MTKKELVSQISQHCYAFNSEYQIDFQKVVSIELEMCETISFILSSPSLGIVTFYSSEFQYFLFFFNKMLLK